MKMLRPLLVFTLLASVITPALFAQAKARPSPATTISTRVGDRKTGNFVMVSYGRPHAKNPKTGENRTVWGELVPWDKAWRLGANEATTIAFNKPIVIGDTTISGGAYTLYLVPSQNGTTQLAFSSNIAKWGVPVDQKHDIARVNVKKQALDKPVEQLTLGLRKEGENGGVLSIRWAKTAYSVAFTNAP